MAIVSTDSLRLLLTGVVACLAPLLIHITRATLLPVMVLKIVGGTIIGPQVLHWVSIDPALHYLLVLGPSYLLFLSGLEVDLQHLLATGKQSPDCVRVVTGTRHHRTLQGPACPEADQPLVASGRVAPVCSRPGWPT